MAKAERRRFTAEYKRRIVREADRCTTPGAIGALLRREGLYSSLLTTWRAARERGELEGLAPKKRGPKGVPPDPRDKKIAEQEREIAKLEEARRAGRGAGGGPKKSRGVAGDPVREREMMIATVREVGPRLGIAPTCAALGLPAATYYRRIGADAAPRTVVRARRARWRPPSARRCWRCCTSPVRRSRPGAGLRAAARDERYLCSERTMYRILEANTRCGSGAISCATRPTRRPSSWPPRRTSSGAGTSPSCSGRRSGPTSTST